LAFTRRQLEATVAWRATMTTLLALLAPNLAAAAPARAARRVNAAALLRAE